MAPEMGGLLLGCCRQVLRYGGRLLSPDADFVEIASDKGATHCLLQKAGVPVPFQQLLRPGQELPRQFRYPAIVKTARWGGIVSGADGPGLQRPGRAVRWCELALSRIVLSGNPSQRRDFDRSVGGFARCQRVGNG